MYSENYLPLLESLAPVIQSILRRISRWRTPLNWTRADWASEEQSVVNLAVCETLTNHSTDSGSLEHVVYFHALSRALTRYRQECVYAGRFLVLTPTDGSDDVEESFRTESRSCSVSTEASSIPESLAVAMESLSEPDGRLIQELFWQKHTQAEIARELHISQRAVSGRKRRALDSLRSALQQRELACSPRLVLSRRKSLGKNILKKMHTEVLKSVSQSNIDHRSTHDEKKSPERIGI